MMKKMYDMEEFLSKNGSVTIYTTVFILGFGYRKETDSQNKNNDTINTDTDKEKT